jgi:hypothetical protein
MRGTIGEFGAFLLILRAQHKFTNRSISYLLSARTPKMLFSTFGSVLFAAAFIASPATAQIIENFDIDYKNLTTSWQNNVVSEITLNYDIGKSRAYQVALFDKDCVGTITGTTTNITTTITAGSSANHDGLAVSIDLDKSTITASNIWAEDESLEFCVRLRLLSGSEIIQEQ